MRLRRHKTRWRSGDGLPGGGLYAFTVLGFPELEVVGDGAIADFADYEAHLDFILETKGSLEAAGRLYARPADAFAAGSEIDGKVDGAKELVLADFHPAVKVGEVHDAGEISLGELDPACDGKLGWHEWTC